MISDLKNTMTNDLLRPGQLLGAGFNGTFSSLTTNAFSYSVITDLKATLSTDFNQTWTILGAGFNGTFSALNALSINNQGTFSALNACCNNINNEFQQTWTIEAAGFNGTFSVLNVITQNLCNPTMITQANFGAAGGTTYVISTSGVYKLGSNIVFSPLATSTAILITTTGVVLDLQCFTISQGNTTANVNGIGVNNGLTDITIKNGMIESFTRAGVSIQFGCNRISIQNIDILFCATRAIELLGTAGAGQILNSEIANCNILYCSQGVNADFPVYLLQCHDCSVYSCNIKNNGVNTNAISVLNLNSSTECTFRDINIYDNIGLTLNGIQLITTSSLNMFSNCIIEGNSGTNTSGTVLSGININACTNNMFNSCKVLQNNAPNAATLNGFLIQGASTNNMFMGCIVSWNAGGVTSGICNGFNVSGTTSTNFNNMFIDCISSANSGPTTCLGFALNGTSTCLILRCVSANNSATGAGGLAAGLNLVSPGGGFRCEIKECNFSNNIGVSAANSFGVLVNTGSNNLFTKNIAWSNGSTSANQMSGVPGGSVTTPTAPASSNIAAVTGAWTNIAAGS